MLLRGNVEDIIFRNEENGYTVMNFNADDNLIVAVGIFPFVNEGETLELRGEFRNNPKFGEQFVVEYADFIKPNDVESIKRFLSSGLFYGVGEVTAQAIVQQFGLRTLEIIEQSPEKLTLVNGIGQKKAVEISKCYTETSKVKDTILFLQKYGITTAMALKIYKEYQENTINIVKDNPYALVEDVEGIGFITADKLAEKLGIEKDSDFRLKAALLHTLKEGSQKNGHTFLPQELLLKETMKLTSVYEEQRLLDILENEDASIKKAITEEDTAYSLSYIFHTENSIAAKLVNLRNLSGELKVDIEKELSDYEKSNDIILDDNQKQAIKKALTEGVIIITGGPGTGKTTIIKCVTTILAQRNIKVALAAPTGRAAKRMSEATGEDAKTLHRLLGINGKNFLSNEMSPLDYDVIIVDEISMADIFIFNALLKAIKTGARLILVGDKDQLPSVACGNILADMIASGVFCTVYLNEIYRQAKESMIVINAHRINNSEMPITKNSKDFFIDNKSSPYDIKNSIITMVSRRIPQYMSIQPMDIQVLSPMKKGVVGVESMNKELQKALNPSGKELVFKDIIFRKGDKVMQTVNNYSIEWIKYQPYRESGTGVFNGDIGYINEIRDKNLVVDFEDGKQVVYQYGDLEELMPAYCISVHKSQGSEFPVVIMAITSGSYAILTKNLLYTAVTRAKDMVVLIGDEENIAKMVKNNYMTKRFSLLKHFILKNQGRFHILRGIEES